MSKYLDVRKCTPGEWEAACMSLAEAKSEGSFEWMQMGHKEGTRPPHFRVGEVYLVGRDDKGVKWSTGLPGHIETTEANARLIAEAGTVAHETGKGPRQLADERAALLEALRQLLKFADYASESVDPGFYQIGIDNAKAAITLAEGTHND